MKKLILLFLVFSSHFLFGQRVVTLSVVQPPEFGFSISKPDTTIIKGSSIVLGTDLIVFGGSGEYTYHWVPTGTLSDPSISNPIASPTDTTSYLLTITDKYGCSITLYYTVNVTSLTGLHNLTPLSQSLQAVLFPNPNKGILKLNITGQPVKKLTISLFDSHGKVLKKQIINGFTGDQTETLQLNFVSGNYIVLIKSGTESISRKFIIQ